MNITQVKETLAAIGYPAKGPDWNDVLADLHSNYGAQKVGSSVRTLGDAEPLYHKAGSIAFMVDNPQDLIAACIRIRSKLAAINSAKLIVMPRETLSRYIPDIRRALEGEIDLAFRVNRPLNMIDADYSAKHDSETRSPIRKSDQILDDLLSDDKRRNDKAVKAFKELLLIGK